MLHHIFNPIDYSIPDPAGPWEQMSLVYVFNPEYIKHKGGKKERNGQL